MAKKKTPTEKVVEKTVKKVAKQVKKGNINPVLIIVLIILLTAGFIAYQFVVVPYLEEHNSSSSHEKVDALVGEIYDDFQVHFLENGNAYAGDSIYIKAGEVDILIDAGSRQSSASILSEQINQYCNDGKLEFAIATHADQDHISGFVGTSDKGVRNGIFYAYEIGTIIDFNFANKELTTAGGNPTLYSNYLEAIDYAVSKGSNHYHAGECFNEENGAKKSYQLSEYVTMDILYNKYYFEPSSDENNHSVCVLFTYEKAASKHSFLFTGDLEKEGEKALSEYYQNHDGLGHVDLFKAGHHGSATSSNDSLLSLITPDICCVCCCAGNPEYTTYRENIFPTQAFINRIAPYTDQVYVTTVYDEEEKTFKPMNGKIVVSCMDDKVAVSATNNTTKLKDTTWMSHVVYVDDNDKIVSKEEAVHEVPCRTMPTSWK